MILILFSVVNKIANDYIIRVLSFKLNYFRYKNIFESNFHHKISERTLILFTLSKSANAQLVQVYDVVVPPHRSIIHSQSRKSMTKIPHDQLAKEFLQEILSPLGTVERSFEVPGEPRFIDVWFRPHHPRSGTAQPPTLLERITTTPCSFECFHNPPSRQEIRRSLVKLLWVHDEELRKDESIPDAQLPMLWVLANSISGPILAEGKGEISPQWLPGIYFCGNLFKTVLVVIQELPQTEETLWLRILGSGKTQEQAIGEVLAMPETDPQQELILRMLTSWKVRIEMIGTLDTEDEEWLMALSQAYLEWEQQTERRGEERGRQEGRQVGRQEERDRILALVVPNFLELGLTMEQIAQRLQTDVPTIERIIQQQQARN